MDLGAPGNQYSTAKENKYERAAKSFKRPMQLGGSEVPKDGGKFSIGRSIENPFAKKSMGMESMLKQSMDLKSQKGSENNLLQRMEDNETLSQGMLNYGSNQQPNQMNAQDNDQFELLSQQQKLEELE